MIIGFRSGVYASVRSPRTLAIFTLALIPSVLVGCSNNARPTIGPIEFTTASGVSAPAVTSLAVNGQIYLVATVSDDDQYLGVSWTVTCGSAQPPSSGSIDTSCGTFVPSQTESGPVPAYPSSGFVATYSAPPEVPKGSTVTITAHATSLPSVASTVTLTIVPAPPGNSAIMSPGAVPGGIQDAAHGLALSGDESGPEIQKEK